MITSFQTWAGGLETDTDDNAVERMIASARVAQRDWARQTLASRLEFVRRARFVIAEEAVRLANAANHTRQRSLAEVLTAEVLPLADACRYLESRSARILQPHKLGRRGRPLWLHGVATEIRRRPHGLALIIAPGNYPLFLPAVQTLQALVAGNSVLIKPGPGGVLAARAFVDILHRAGLPRNLVHVLSEEASAAKTAIRVGVDKVVLTGSAATGEAVLAQCAKTITPATVELSGCDAMFVRADADLELVVRAIKFGLRLNNGATCIAPRRVFVHDQIAAKLQAGLRAIAFNSSIIVHAHLVQCVMESLLGGADLIHGRVQSDGKSLSVPLILKSVQPTMRIVSEDIFAPVLSLIGVCNDTEALEFAAQCPYALGATIFSRNGAAARALASRVRAGFVIINDLIVPTADPRLPFGGRGRSGFGTTRGKEGLLEMTVPKVISVRRSRSHLHLDQPQAGDTALFAAYIRATHGHGWRKRFSAIAEICRSIRRRNRS